MVDPVVPGTGHLGPDRLALDLFMTVIRVANWKTTVAWYIHTLGLCPVLLDSQHEFALLPRGADEWESRGVQESRSSEVSARVRLVFEVQDLDEERRRLIEQGVAVGEPSRELRGRISRSPAPVSRKARVYACSAWTDPARGDAFTAAATFEEAFFGEFRAML